jgi:hypothetical protein
MAIVIPVEKLLKGIQTLSSKGPIWVKLRDENTCYKDRDTGWVIKGSESKELPIGPTGVPVQSLLACVRAGRFVKVESPKGSNTKSKADDLIEYILRETRGDSLEEGLM